MHWKELIRPDRRNDDKMINYEKTVNINCPVDQVFALITDAKNLRRWQASLIENELMTEGPLKAGTRFREKRRMGSRETVIEGEITEFVPNERFATKTLTSPNVTVSYTLEPVNGGTRVTYRFTMIAKGFMRLLEPFFLGSIKNDTEADFANLRQILEGNSVEIKS